MCKSSINLSLLPRGRRYLTEPRKSLSPSLCVIVCVSRLCSLAGSQVSTSGIRALGNAWISFDGVDLDWGLDLVDLRLWRDKN